MINYGTLSYDLPYTLLCYNNSKLNMHAGMRRCRRKALRQLKTGVYRKNLASKAGKLNSSS